MGIFWYMYTRILIFYQVLGITWYFEKGDKLYEGWCINVITFSVEIISQYLFSMCNTFYKVVPNIVAFLILFSCYAKRKPMHEVWMSCYPMVMNLLCLWMMPMKWIAIYHWWDPVLYHPLFVKNAWITVFDKIEGSKGEWIGVPYTFIINTYN